jgi:hypothetical protein
MSKRRISPCISRYPCGSMPRRRRIGMKHIEGRPD